MDPKPLLVIATPESIPKRAAVLRFTKRGFIAGAAVKALEFVVEEGDAVSEFESNLEEHPVNNAASKRAEIGNKF